MYNNGKSVIFTVSLARPHKSSQLESLQSYFEETASSENMVHDGCLVPEPHTKKLVKIKRLLKALGKS